MNILVTAVQGDLGQSIVKALRLSASGFVIHGTDVSIRGVGASVVDNFSLLPKANDAGYIHSLIEYCKKNTVKAVIPACEPEIFKLSELTRFPMLTDETVVVAQPSAWLNQYGDKLTCMQNLVDQVKLADFADADDKESVQSLVQGVGFPLVVKPRRASGSNQIHVAQDVNALMQAIDVVPNALVQEYIADDDGEFSIGCFRCAEFAELIAFKRQLGPGGCSWYAETCQDPEVLQYAETIMLASGLQGSANIQLRKTKRGPRLLEINPRFSSLVAARALAGFVDVEWSVCQALKLPMLEPVKPFKSLKYQRYVNELVAFEDDYRAVKEWMPAVL